MRIPVYLGATAYAAGECVPIERAIGDAAVCAQLRHADHGADRFPLYEGNILDLARRAARQSLEAAGLAPQQVDALFVLSTGLDAADNLEGAWLGDLLAELDLGHASHYQLGMTGCGGFHWAARLAAALVASGQCRHILLLAFDQAGGKLQRLYGAGTDFPYVTGDAAAACIIGADPRRMGYRLRGDVVNLADSRQIRQPSMDSEMRCIARMFKQTYAAAGIAPSDVAYLVTNNYSYTVSRLYCQLAKLGAHQAYTGTIASHAHCFSADNIINLHQLTASRDVRDGDNVMLFSTGPYQWGACVLERLPAAGSPA